MFSQILSNEKVIIEYKDKKRTLEYETLNIKIIAGGKETFSCTTSIGCVQSFYGELKKQLDGARSYSEIAKYFKPSDDTPKDKSYQDKYFKGKEVILSHDVVIRKKIIMGDIEIIVLEIEADSKHFAGYFTQKVDGLYYINPKYILSDELAVELSSKGYDVLKVKEHYDLLNKREMERKEKQKNNQNNNTENQQNKDVFNNSKEIEIPINAKNNDKKKPEKSNESSSIFYTISLGLYEGEVNDSALDEIRKIEPILFFRQMHEFKQLCVGFEANNEEGNKKLLPKLKQIQGLNEKYKNAVILEFNNALPTTSFLIGLLFNSGRNGVDYLFEDVFYYNKTQEEKIDLKKLKETYELIENKNPNLKNFSDSVFNQYLNIINTNSRTEESIDLARKWVNQLKSENKLIEIHFSCWLVGGDEKRMDELNEKIPYINEIPFGTLTKNAIIDYILKTISKSNGYKLKEVFISCLNIIKNEKVSANNRRPYNAEGWENIIKNIKKVAEEKKINLSENFKELDSIKVIEMPK